MTAITVNAMPSIAASETPRRVAKPKPCRTIRQQAQGIALGGRQSGCFTRNPIPLASESGKATKAVGELFATHSRSPNILSEDVNVGVSPPWKSLTGMTSDQTPFLTVHPRRAR